MWGLISRALNCTWFFGLDAKKSWVVLSGLLGGFDSHLVDHSNMYGQIGAPLQGLIFSRSHVVRGYG